MMEEGILDGDFVICKHTPQAREGEIVVALIDNQDATLKRISYKIQDRITLIPANPTFKPKAYLMHRVQVQGVFIGLLRLRM
jgi:repressor LexA